MWFSAHFRWLLLYATTLLNLLTYLLVVTESESLLQPFADLKWKRYHCCSTRLFYFTLTSHVIRRIHILMIIVNGNQRETLQLVTHERIVVGSSNLVAGLVTWPPCTTTAQGQRSKVKITVTKSRDASVDENAITRQWMVRACDEPSGGRRLNPKTLYIINSLQLSSSDQSPQLSSPSHRYAAARHSPVLWHVNWSARHATHTRVSHMRIKLPTYLLAADRHRHVCHASIVLCAETMSQVWSLRVQD